MNKNWIRIRWMDSRSGTSIYLLFGLSLTNFILISYNFLLEKDPLFDGLISDLWIFALIFLISYVPISIIIGFWHRKTQLKVDTTLAMYQNPFTAKMFRTILDVQTGKATTEEIEEFRKLLLKIEKKFEISDKS